MDLRASPWRTWSPVRVKVPVVVTKVTVCARRPPSAGVRAVTDALMRVPLSPRLATTDAGVGVTRHVWCGLAVMPSPRSGTAGKSPPAV